MNKDLLFYSKSCDHCKDVINIIIKNNIREQFLFVSVDENRYKIPQFVTHVPTILTKQKHVLFNKSLVTYVENIIQSMSVNNNDISPFSLSDTGYSTQYTWLTDNGYDNEGKLSEDKIQYTALNLDTKIFTPPEADISNKSNKFDDSIYEKYINSRTADDDMIKKQYR
jgi:hypothetical protein